MKSYIVTEYITLFLLTVYTGLLISGFISVFASVSKVVPVFTIPPELTIVMAVIWKDETNITTVDELSQYVPGGPSAYHDPKLANAEAEILEHYREFARFCNKICLNDPDYGRRYYDLKEACYFDLMGQVPRPKFEAHYNNITPYLADAQIAFKDMEVVAVTEDFGYVTALQRYWGTAKDGNDFDFTFRTTSLLRKNGGVWKYVHEHFSFPTNMATQKVDMTCGLDYEKSIKLI